MERQWHAPQAQLTVLLRTGTNRLALNATLITKYCTELMVRVEMDTAPAFGMPLTVMDLRAAWRRCIVVQLMTSAMHQEGGGGGVLDELACE